MGHESVDTTLSYKECQSASLNSVWVVTYTMERQQFSQDTSIRFLLGIIGSILRARFIGFVNRHSSFLWGLTIGGPIGSILTFLVVVGIPFIPVYDGQPQQQIEVVPLPAQTETELIDTELTGNASGFDFTGRFIANNAQVKEFECNINDEGYEKCNPPVKQDDLAPGNHTFEVRSTLPNGTKDPTPAAFLWEVK